MISIFYYIFLFFFFFNDTATTEIYTLSLHDALPIFRVRGDSMIGEQIREGDCIIVESRQTANNGEMVVALDRKSTRLNSSHDQISYAVFCLKKKKKRKYNKNIYLTWR